MKRIYLYSLVIAILSAPAMASDVVAERKANFKANGGAMRAMGGLIGAGDFDAIAANADKISRWASVMPDYFPEGSESDGAKEDIWFEFERFTALSIDNKNAADALKMAAMNKDSAAVKQAVGALGATCKSCHSSFKN